MSLAEVWFGGSDRMYIDRSAIVVRRHNVDTPGRYEIAYTGGPEAVTAVFGGARSWCLAVVDDFGNLVRVPS